MSWLSKFGGKSKPEAAAAASSKTQSVPPPTIRIDSHDYPAAEFVAGGFRIRPYDGDLIPKQSFDFRVTFSLNNEPVEVACRGMVVRLDDQSGLVARYAQPQPFYERRIADYLKLWQQHG